MPWQPFRCSAPPMPAAFGESNGWVKMLTGFCLLKLLCSSAPTLAQELVCLESSPDCLATLTDLAIQNSSEIEAIDQRLAVMAQRIDYAESRRWTNYLTLDPLELVQNLLGGGDVQRDQVAIASLEVQAADLVRRREEVAEDLAREVIALVMDHERLDRELTLLASQLETQQLQQAVQESAYRTGQGNTVQMMSVWQRTEDLQAQQQERSVAQAQVRRQLEQITGLTDVSVSVSE